MNYYPDEYTIQLDLYCEECNMEYEKEVDVKDNWISTTCPFNHRIEREMR